MLRHSQGFPSWHLCLSESEIPSITSVERQCFLPLSLYLLQFDHQARVLRKQSAFAWWVFFPIQKLVNSGSAYCSVSSAFWYCSCCTAWSCLDFLVNFKLHWNSFSIKFTQVNSYQYGLYFLSCRVYIVHGVLFIFFIYVYIFLNNLHTKCS